MTAALSLLAALLAPTATAADVTELAPMLRGDVQLRYDIDAERARLLEGETVVGRRALTDHILTWSGSFSFYTGAALFMELPQYASSRIRFREAQSAGFDPVNDAGTFVGTPSLGDPDPTLGKGLGGTWLGLRGSPYHEQLFADRGDRASVLLEAAYRFQDQTNLWSYGPRETRGAGPGGAAFRLRGAFSTTHRSAQPYLVATWVRPTGIQMDVTDANNRIIAQGRFTPASDLELLAGTELTVSEYQDGGQVNLDFRGRFGYRSWQDIPSGLYLPDVLNGTAGQTATESEYAYLTGSVGVNWRMIHYLQLNVAGDFGFATPRTVEHFYPVTTGLDTVVWGVTTSLRFRIRDDLFAKAQPAAPAAPALPSAPSY